MDRLLTTLFNGGNNDGNIIVRSQDDVELRCHKFVVVLSSHFFKSAIAFKKQAEVPRRVVELDWPATIVTEALALMYNQAHQFDPKLTASDIIRLHCLIDFLQFNRTVEELENITNGIIDAFGTKLNSDNWLPLMQEVFPTNNKLFIAALLTYYIQRISILPDFVTVDPLRTLDVDSPLYRFMIQIYRQWLRNYYVLYGPIPFL